MSRIVSTDDASRRLQFVWLGPVSSPWPFEARGQMWAVAGGCAVVSAPIIFLLVLGELDTPRPDGPPVTYLVAAPSDLFIERRAAHRQVQAVVVPEFVTAAADELLEA